MMEGRNVERPAGQGRLSHDGFDAPKGPNNIAQGFSPGLAFQKMRPESIPNLAVARCNSDKAFLEECLTSGARIRSFSQSPSRLIGRPASPVSCASFRARGLGTANPGLKPWAELFCPFGAGPDRQPRTRAISRFSPSSFHGEKTITAF
jgi:hypothetical protein